MTQNEEKSIHLILASWKVAANENQLTEMLLKCINHTQTHTIAHIHRKKAETYLRMLRWLGTSTLWNDVTCYFLMSSGFWYDYFTRCLCNGNRQQQQQQLTSWVEQLRSNLYKDGKVTGARFPSEVPGQTIVPQPTTVSQPLRTSESEPSEKSPLQALFPTTDINLPDNS